MHILLAVSFASHGGSAGLDTLVERCGRRLPSGFDPTPRVVRWPDCRTVLLLWSNGRLPGEHHVQTERVGLAYAGYLTEDDTHPSTLLRRLAPGDGPPRFAESTGGLAAFCHLERATGTAVAWATRPMVVGLFYGRNGAGVAAAGTRPLMVATALGEPRWNGGYARAALSAGFPLGLESPFEGVSAAESGQAVTLRDGDVSVGPHAPPAVTTSGDAFQNELLRAVGAVGRFLDRPGGVEFRLSGGKDSRLIAAAARHLGLEISVLTRGGAGWGEVVVARQVADALGFAHRNEDTPEPPDIRAAMETAMRLRDAATYPEMMLCLNDLAHYPSPAVVLVKGHSHLQRGGWSRRLRPRAPRPAVRKATRSDFVRAEVGAAQAGAIDQWFETHRFRPAVRNPLRWLYASVYLSQHHYLFWAYEFFQVSKYLQSLRLFHENYTLCVFPLLDERFVHVCADLTPVERTREIAVFRALRDFAPAASRIPLFDDRFRFEKSGPHAGFRDGYAARDPASIPQTASDRSEGGRFYMNARTGRAVRDGVLNSALWRDLRPLLTPDCVRALERMGRQDEWWRPPPGAERRDFVKFSWVLYAQAVASEISW